MKTIRLALALFASMYFVFTAHADLLVYEGFDYSTAELSGQGGGLGWDGNWTRSSDGTDPNALFDVSQDGVSLDSPAYPVATTGGRLSVAGAGGSGGNNTHINRTLAAENQFDFTQAGTVRYVSFLLQKDTNAAGTSQNNLELDLLSATTGNQLLRIGGTSDNQWFLFSTSAANVHSTFALEETYFVVVRVEAEVLANTDRYSAMFFDSSREVPTAEPETWDAANNFNSNGIVGGIRLWTGRNTAGQFDEIRLGTTWSSVTVDEVGGGPILPGDFNDDDHVDGTDLGIWKNHFGTPSGGTTATGDANGDTLVDGTDFLIWQRNVTGSPEVAAVPEPATSLLAIAAMAALLKKRRGR